MGRVEEQPAEGGVSMGSSEDLASLLHTAGYESHHGLRLCTPMHPVPRKSSTNQSIYSSCLWDSSGESIDSNWENNIH